ncbi:MAG: hypothetical protein CM15mP89_4580 [Gammaproteobacteria bacterium]|nr:MAG: hypothetical protein CM15mP89_4580 [Gammaproteobacteria bacterium]
MRSSVKTISWLSVEKELIEAMAGIRHEMVTECSDFGGGSLVDDVRPRGRRP